MNIHHKREKCRACGGSRVRRFLALGPTPLANAFLKNAEEFKTERSYPLDVYFCETCSLVQLLDVIDKETLFRNYIYVTGTSDTIAQHNIQYASNVIELLELSARDLVVEIASNDGSLLQRFQERGVKTLGIEPANNIAAIASSKGIVTLGDFFSTPTARKARESHGPAKAVIANNVLAHVDDPQDFLAGCKHLLAPDGLVIIEVPYLGELIDRLEYDTVYHEHLCYFSTTALIRLCDAVGLSLVRIDRVAVHGGSLRFYACNKEGYHAEHVLDLAAREKSAGITSLTRLERFAKDVEESRHNLRALLIELKEKGHSVAGYGAPAKGNTLLNYCKIDTRLLPYTVDKNPMKVNLFTPGMHIPVLAPETLLERQPMYVLLLAWNFADEIMRQQHEYRRRGGRFILPLPKAQVV